MNEKKVKPMMRGGIIDPVGPGREGLARLTVLEFLDLLKRREVSVLEYTRACADVIDWVEPDVHAWEWYRRERFEDLARRADQVLAADPRKNGPGLSGALFGVPVGVKDIFNTDDMPTTHGSGLFAGYTPGNDARAVTNLKREGAIMAGKTVTAEFAVHTPNGTRNPHDLRRSSGTSSSGSAVAVATAMVPVALASQTAGSIMRPASYCGVFGFKPSYGTIPRTAVLKTTDTLDTIGFMSRSVRDLTLVFEVLRVKGLNYPIVHANLDDPARRKQPAQPWRVGVLEGPKSRLESAAVKQRTARLAERLAAEGCRVEPLALPAAFAEAHEVHEAIYCRSLCYYFRMEWESGQHEFSPGLARMIDAGTKISFAQYERALVRQTELARLFDGLLADTDVVICPSTANEAPIGIDSDDIPDHCLIFTMCYTPTISLPLLQGTSGFPVGAQIASRRFNDYLLLDFARYLCEMAE